MEGKFSRWAQATDQAQFWKKHQDWHTNLNQEQKDILFLLSKDDTSIQPDRLLKSLQDENTDVFLTACLEVCYRTKKIEEKFLPMFSLLENWLISKKVKIARNEKPILRLYASELERAITEKDSTLLCELLQRLPKSDSDYLTLDELKKNCRALISSCEANNYEMTQKLVSTGFYLYGKLEKLRYGEQQSKMHKFRGKLISFDLVDKADSVFDKHDGVSILCILKAMVQPAYILACYKEAANKRSKKGEQFDSCRFGNAIDHQHCPKCNEDFEPRLECRDHTECTDPFFVCCKMCELLKESAEELPEFKPDFKALQLKARSLMVDLLGECRTKDDVRSILTNGRNDRNGIPLIREAMELNNKEFVGHIYPQQFLRQQWSAGVNWQMMSIWKQVAYSLLQVLMIPVMLIPWLLLKFVRDLRRWKFFRPEPREDQGQEDGSSCLSRGGLIPCIDVGHNKFIVFSVFYLVYLSILMYSMIEVSADYTISHFLLGIYALAFLWQDLKVALSLKSGNKFFSAFWRSYDLVLHLTLATSLLCRSVHHYVHGGLRPFVLSALLQSANNLLSIAVTLSLLKLCYWFLLHSILGPVIINFSRVINDIIVAICAYIIILLSFTFGLMSVLSFVIPIQDFGEYFSHIIVKMFWGTFDPGLPDFINICDIPDNSTTEERLFEECAIGHKSYKVVAYGLYAIYLVLVVIIAMNVLVALMNTTLEKMNDRKQLYWKYARTAVWLEFIEETSSPPVPFNILELMYVPIYLILYVAKASCKQTNKARNRSEETYFTLITTLIERYIKDSNVPP